MRYNHKKIDDKPYLFSHKYVQLLLIFSSLIIIYGMHTSMSVAIIAMTDMKQNGTYFEKFDWDSSQKSIILSSLFLGILIIQMPCFYIARTYNTQKLLCLGLLLNGFLYILAPFILKLGWVALVCSRVIEGLFQGCVTSCISILVARWMLPSEGSKSGSLVLSGSQIGIAIAMFISGVLAESNLGWPSIFYVFGSASIIWAIIFYFAVKSSSNYLNHMVSTEAQIQDVPWKEMLSSTAVWSLIIVTCGQSWNFCMLIIELPMYLKYILHFDIYETGLYSAIPYIAMWILGLLIWWLSNLAIRYNISIVIVRKINNTIGMWGPAILMIILCIVETSNKAIVVVILTMIVAFNVAVNYGHQINHLDLSANFSRDILSISITLGSIFSLFAPIVCGFIISDMANVEQWKSVFYITASINFFTNLIFILFGEVEGQFWGELVYSRNRNHACRISTITSAYNITLKSVSSGIRADFVTDNDESELSNDEKTCKYNYNIV